MGENKSNTTIKILAVNGLDVSDSRHYDNLVHLLDNNDNIVVQYFSPDFNKSFDDVLNTLDKIADKKFDIMIGHGLGCLLITQLIKKKQITNAKIILSNPILITPSIITYLLSLYPDALTSYIPPVFKHIVIPQRLLTFDTKHLPFSYYFETISLTFIISALKYTNNIENILNIYNTYKNNIHIIYGINDNFAPIPKSIQDRLATYVKFVTMDTSRHEPFNDYKTIQNNYKQILFNIIDKFTNLTI